MYRNVSEEFKKAIKSNTIISTAKLTFPNLDNLVIDGSLLQDCNITDFCYNEGQLIGTAMCKEVEATFDNKNGYELQDQEFILEVGVKLENGEYEYIPYGNYIIKDYEDTKSNNNYKLIAYDYMDKLNAPISENKDFKPIFPIKAKEYYKQLLNSYGVEVEEQTLPNENFMINSNISLEGLSGRSVLSYLAELFGKFAKINRNNKCEMYLENKNNESLDDDIMNTSLVINDKYGPVNIVTIGMSDIEGENVSLPDTNYLKMLRSKEYIEIPLQEELLEGDYITNTEHHNWKKLVFTGDENISSATTTDGTNRYSYATADKVIGFASQMYCTHFEFNTTDTYKKDKCFGGSNNGKAIWFRDDEKFPTLADFKSFLKAQYNAGTPVIVYYQLAEPTNLTLTTEQNKTRNDIMIASKLETFRIDGKSSQIVIEGEEGTKTTRNTISISDANVTKESSLTIKGNIKQETTTGKNILKFPYKESTTVKNGVTFTVNDDGTVLVNGTSSNDALFYLAGNNIELAETIRNKEMILSGCPKGGSEKGYRMQIWNNNADGKVAFEIGSGVNFTYTNLNNNYNIVIYIPKGLTVNNLSFKPMIRLTTVTDDTYEPFTNGASPNPDYPQEIEVVKGKNLFDKNTAILNNYLTQNDGTGNSNVSNISDYIDVSNFNNVTFNYTNDTNSRSYCLYDKNKKLIRGVDGIKPPKTVDVSNAFYIRFAYFKEANDVQLVEGTTVTDYLPYNTIEIKKQNKNLAYLEAEKKYRQNNSGKFSANNDYNSYIAKVNSNTSYIASYKNVKYGQISNLCYFNENMEYITGIAYASENKTFTTPNNCKFVTIAVHKDTIDFQLEEGTTVTDYIEHQEQSYPLSLGNLELTKDDYFFKQNNKWYLHKEWKKVVLTGDENWRYGDLNNGIYNYSCKVDNIYDVQNDKINIYSTHYKGVKWNNSWLVDNSIVSFINQKAIRIMTSQYTTTTDLKSWLKSQYGNGTPVIVYYLLATPTNTEITDTTLIEQLEALNNIQLYNGINNISSDSIANLSLHYNYVTPSPSPNRPSEISTVTSPVKVKVEYDGTPDTEIQIMDNPFLYTEELRENAIQQLYSNLRGFSYTPTEFNGKSLLYTDCGDKIRVLDVKSKEYVNTLILNQTINIPKTRSGKYSNLALSNTAVKNKYVSKSKQAQTRTEIMVDKQNQIIEGIVSQTTEQNTKIANVQMTVDELNSKITDIADITQYQETQRGYLEFEKVNQSEPIHIEIYPTVENITYLYPRENLYPADNLYSTRRTLRFTNTETKEVIDYELPDDLLLYNSEIYDKFVLDYDSQTIYISKKCAYANDGTVVATGKEIITEYEYPHILLEDGNYKIELLKFDNGVYNAFMLVRLMEQNIYTTQFATKAEMNSVINQTSQDITLSVDKKLESYPTTTEMNSAITITANEINSEVKEKVGNDEIISRINQTKEAITIDANKVSLKGKSINLSSDNINISSNNFTVNSNGDMSCSNANITGNVIANSGKIGGWAIDSNALLSSQNGQGAGVMGTTVHGNIAFYAGADTTNIGSAPFRVYHDGTVVASNASISGNITANRGKIANYTISGAQLIGNNVGMSGTSGQGYAFWAGSNSSGSAPFRVGHDGSIVANNGTFTGNYTVGSSNSLSTYNSSGQITSSLTSDSLFFYNGGSRIGGINARKGSIPVLSANDAIFISTVTGGGVSIYKGGMFVAGKVTELSLGSEKKNFEKFKNGLDVILNTDIYEYHFKTQEDTEKKNIGFVIGDDYKYSKKITNEENNGVDIYSMIAVAYKAIQEQQEEIEELKKEIKKLKGGKE